MSDSGVDAAGIMAVLEKMARRCEAATEGPWKFHRENLDVPGEIPCYVLKAPKSLPDVLCRYWSTGFDGTKDAPFIAHARSDIPCLCHAIVELLDVATWKDTDASLAVLANVREILEESDNAP